MRRSFVAGGLVTGALAGGGCALVGGFDFGGFTPAPGADASADAGARDAQDRGDAREAGDLDAKPLDVEDAPDATAGDGFASDAPSSPVVCASDGDSCGGCGHSCQGGACAGDTCLPVALAAVSAPGGLAVTASSVYWVDGADVMTATVGAGAASTFYATSSALSGSIVVDSTNVYWSSSIDVQTAFLAGGGGYYFDGFSSTVEALTEIAVDAANLYAVRDDFTVQGGGCPSVQIDVAPLAHGGAVTSWTGGVCHVVRIVSDGAHVYWTDTGTSNSFAHPAVFAQAVDGGTPIELAPAQNPAGIAVFGGVLYWADTNAGALYAWPTDGSRPPVTVATSPGPGDLAVDASGLYWIDGQSAVMHASLDGGAGQALATGQAAAASIATNAASVFWMQRGLGADGGPRGAVMKLAK